MPFGVKVKNTQTRPYAESEILDLFMNLPDTIFLQSDLPLQVRLNVACSQHSKPPGCVRV